MAYSVDPWMREYNEASKLADDITGMISERSSFGTGPEAQRHSSAIRRKITILGTRLDSLQSLLTKLPAKQPLTEKEMNRRRDMLANLRTKVTQMASALNMSSFGNRDSLLGPDTKPPDDMARISGLDNAGIVGLQRQVMRGKLLLLYTTPFKLKYSLAFELNINCCTKQDEGLEKLEQTVISTKHIALAVNEELDLHTRLIDDLDEHVEVTDSRLKRVQKNLAILNKRAKSGCTCMCLLLSVVGIVGLVVALWLIIKYL
ncbi:putative target SNARE coiled-coil domain-containing protein [Helianthus anomalus]